MREKALLKIKVFLNHPLFPKISWRR